MKPRSSALRRDTFLLLAGGVITRLCGFVFVMILSRTLSAREIGVFSFAEAIADTFILIASFNLDSLIVRRIASGPEAEATRRFAPLLGFRILSAPIYLAVLFWVSHEFTSENRWVLPVVAVCTLMESLYFCISDLFVGIKQPGYRAAIEVVAETIFTACFLVVMYRWPSLRTLIVVSLVRGVLMLAFTFYLVRRRFGPLYVSWDKSLIREGLPFLMMTFLAIIQGKTETLLLGVLRDYDAVGYFQLALRLFTAALFIPMGMGSAVFPRFAETGMDAVNLQRLRRGLTGLAALGLVGMGIMIFWPGPGTRLIFGPKATQVIPILRSLGPLLPIRFATLFLATALSAVHRERQVLVALFVGTVTGLVADLLLIPRWGAIGASAGLLVSGSIQLALLAVTCRAWSPPPGQAPLRRLHRKWRGSPLSQCRLSRRLAAKNAKIAKKGESQVVSVGSVL